jgi:hypothetical protein
MTDLQATAMGGGAASTKTANYVLVAADAGTTIAMNAAGATTITVNTGLFSAGDTVFIQNIGAGATTITAGTATVNTAGSLILPQYDAGILYFTSASAAIFYDYIQVGAVSPLTTKGDLYTFSTSDTRLGVGANGTVLTADSVEATGLKWAAASGGITFADYTPSYTNITIGNGTVVARYGQQGKFIFVIWDFIFGSTSSIGSASRVSLPKTAKSTSYIGSMYGLDSGTLEVIGQVTLGSSTEMKMILPFNGTYGATQPTATFPWTWTTNDRITLSMVYEEA